MYRLLSVAFLPVLCLASPLSPLSAQSCIGLPSQSRANVRVGLATPDGSSQLSARAGVLVKRIFGGVSGEYAKVSFLGGSIRTGGADVGVEIPINSKKSVFLCPTVAGSVTRLRLTYPNILDLEDFSLDEQLTTRQVVAALNVGGTVVVSPTVDLVPFASLGVLAQRVNNAGVDPSNPFALLDDPSPNNTAGVLGLGLGLQFSRRYTITASLLQRVVADGGGDALITVSGAIGFGAR
jgi:hypothetical protein